MWKNTIESLKSNIIDIGALAISLMALGLSLSSYFREPVRQSDQLTLEMIRSSYSDFISMTDLRTQHPLHSHLFEVPGTYANIKGTVIAATAESRSKPSEMARLSLEERAVADRLFTMFEQSFYQWRQAQERGDVQRARFLGEVLDYYTGRLLQNPRLLWYWSADGGGLLANFELGTIAYYSDKVKPDSSKRDAVGPFK